MDHYLLQHWLAASQTTALALASGAFGSFEKNALGEFWRDIGNGITGAGGAGWAATRDAFFNLFGAELPAGQPPTGDNAVRDTIGSFLQQIFQGTGEGEGPSTSGSSTAAPESNAAPSSLADVLPPDLGGRTTLADVVGGDAE